METHEISRRELYNEVWAEPMINVARKYGISDVDLAKICRRNNIPVPPRGYWAQKYAGQKVQQIPLPRQKSEPQITISPQPAANVAPLSKELSSAAKKPLVVPDVLTDPHPLISKAAAVLNTRKPGENGLVRADSAKVLDISASPDQIERALRIFDTIIKALETQGIEVLVSDSGTSILANGIQVFFELQEVLDAIPREPTKREREMGRTNVYDYVPSGNLSLSINDPEVFGARRNWKEGKTRFESNLASFVFRLIDYAALVKKQEEERLEREKRWEEERRQRIEREERARKEKEKFSELMTFVQSWQQSQSIRQFADAIEQKIKTSEISIDEEWLVWVRKQADRLDPLVPKKS